MFFNLNAIKDYRKSQKKMAEILNEATMTNTPMSERERYLLERTRQYFEMQCGRAKDLDTILNATEGLKDALRAYDPNPEKEYAMPEWDELTEEQLRSIKKTLGVAGPDKFVYRDIREALSKPKAPTE